jgi:hypothetical protein
LQALCYKSDIEAALRYPPGFGGFQLLDLHDFPDRDGPGGVLNPFWEDKGYISGRNTASSAMPPFRWPGFRKWCI